MKIQPIANVPRGTSMSWGENVAKAPTAARANLIGHVVKKGPAYSKMARKIADLTDPQRPVYLKKSVALLLVRRQVADWIRENVSISRTANRRILKAPIVDGHYVPEKMPANIDRRLGIKFVDPAARAMAQTPQLNKLWMGDKLWLASD